MFYTSLDVEKNHENINKLLVQAFDLGLAVGIIDMIADPFAEFSDALGLTRFMGPILGRRSTRCAMIIEDGILTRMFMEEPAAFEVSSAEHVLANI